MPDTTTDRELLELAAKAAGIEYEWHHGCGDALHLTAPDAPAIYWNPLQDDGDAFQLFCALPWTALETSDVGVTVRERGEAAARVYFMCTEWLHDHGGDIAAATRRAITRAAAEVQRAREAVC